MKKDQRYVGIYNDLYGGMTDAGKIIRDAWALGLLPESETCEGWLAAGIEDLWAKVSDEWEQYGFSVNRLPEEMRERFMRIQDEAMQRAIAADWTSATDFYDDEDDS
jgi:hypothetical protein